MTNLADILSNVYFKNIGLPFFSIFMTTFLKVVSRKDHSLSITRSDLAIGINLIIASLIMLINYTIKLAEQSKTLIEADLKENTIKLLTLFALITIILISAFLLSVFIRSYGWKSDNEKELKTFQGVVIPLVVGVSILVLASNYTN